VVSITPRPRFTPAERAPGTHCTGGWVGPRAGLDAEIRGKALCPCRGSNPGRPVRSQALYRLSYRAPYKLVTIDKTIRCEIRTLASALKIEAAHSCDAFPTTYKSIWCQNIHFNLQKAIRTSETLVNTSLRGCKFLQPGD
jgi:hypothetical protein